MIAINTLPNQIAGTSAGRGVDTPPAIIETSSGRDVAETPLFPAESETNITHGSIRLRESRGRGSVSVHPDQKKAETDFQLVEEHKILIVNVEGGVATFEVMLPTGKRAYKVMVSSLNEMGLAHVAPNDAVRMQIFRGPLGLKSVFSQPDEALIQAEPDAPQLEADYVSFKRKQLGLE